MTNELEQLNKAIDLGQQMAEVLKKSQMSLFGDPHHVGYERTNASGTVSHIQAKGAARAADEATARAVDAHSHFAAASAHLTAATQAGDGTPEAARHGDAYIHHTKMAASLSPAKTIGKVSNVQAKNPRQKMEDMIVAANHEGKKYGPKDHYIGKHEEQHNGKTIGVTSHTGKEYKQHWTIDGATTSPEAVEAHMSAKNPQVKDKTIQARPDHHGAASEQAEVASKHAWTEGDTQEGHDEAERSLVHASSLHDKAATEASGNGDDRTAKWHSRKADLHRQMAEEHGAESNRQWQSEQQTKQVAAANEKLAADRKANPEKAASNQLNDVMNKHSAAMHAKADNFKQSHGYHEIAASEIAGSEARHHDFKEVYGAAPFRYKGEVVPGGTEFTNDFMDKQEANGHKPFVLKHENGSRYLVDPQGYNYARYISKIKE